MSIIDIRAPISFRYINTVLLDVAHFPSRYPELVYRHAPVAEGLHPSRNPICSSVYVEMSRQACASITLNCASELWSVLATCLLALEPSNQITRDVRDFLEKERLGNLRFFEHFFTICKKQFRGTKLYDDLKLIYDIRDVLMHDRPDEINVQVESQIDKWVARFQSRLSESQLKWLPKIPTLYQSDLPVPSGLSCIAIMNFMRYPVAQWIVNSTQSIISELEQMMFAHQGPKRLAAQIIGEGVKFSEDLPLNKFLKIGGISVQIDRPAEKKNQKD